MADDEQRAFFFSIDEIPAYTIAGMLEQSDVDEAERQRLYDIFGRDLLTKVILQSPELCVYHEHAKPGEKVKVNYHGDWINGEVILQDSSGVLAKFNPPYNPTYTEQRYFRVPEQVQAGSVPPPAPSPWKPDPRKRSSVPPSALPLPGSTDVSTGRRW